MPPPHPLTLKGRGYFTNKKEEGGGGIMAPTIISACSKERGWFFQGTNILKTEKSINPWLIYKLFSPWNFLI